MDGAGFNDRCNRNKTAKQFMKKWGELLSEQNFPGILFEQLMPMITGIQHDSKVTECWRRAIQSSYIFVVAPHTRKQFSLSKLNQIWKKQQILKCLLLVKRNTSIEQWPRKCSWCINPYSLKAERRQWRWTWQLSKS